MMEMPLNGETGRLLMREYLDSGWGAKAQHSLDSARFGRKVGEHLLVRNPDLDLDVDKLEFFLTVHDIGYAVNQYNHELHTIELLVMRGMPYRLARFAMHGQYPEEFEHCQGPEWHPTGLLGEILTYADMSVRLGEPMSIDARVEDLKIRVNRFYGDSERGRSILTGLDKAVPRFKSYESKILDMAGVEGYWDF